MARDVVGLLDALGIRKAHIVGASMGGMIAQEIAMQYPERVLSLTSIMSSTGNPKLPPGNPAKHPPSCSRPRRPQRRNTSSASDRPGRSCAADRFRSTRQRTLSAQSAPTRAASIPPVSGGNCAPFSLQAIARTGLDRSRRQRWSFTAPSIRWCGWRPARTRRHPFPAPSCCWSRAWDTRCRFRCGRPSSVRSPSMHVRQRARGKSPLLQSRSSFRGVRLRTNPESIFWSWPCPRNIS